MLIKSLTTNINGRFRNIKFPHNKIVILKGDDVEQVLFVIEALLANDFTDTYAQIDRQFGIEHLPFDNATMELKDGVIEGKGKTVIVSGKLPKIHCIKYIKDDILRSFLIADSFDNTSITDSALRKSSALSEASWIRLVSEVNSILGYDAVELDTEVKFNFVEKEGLSLDAQKAVYLILAESMLTPSGYTRLFIIPSIDGLSDDKFSKLLYRLSLSSTVFTCANLCLTDFSIMASVAELNV